VLCPACRRQVERGASWCGSCGASLGGAGAPLDLVVDGATRVPLVSAVTVGRAAGSTVVLSDPAVSRLHVRIAPGNGGGPVLEDAGSAYGTYVDGVRVTGPVPLHDGAKIRLGDSELAVERRRETIIVPASATVELPAVEHATQFGLRPRVRSGYALRRRDEGERPWVLRDLERDKYLELGDDDVELFRELDGSRSLADLSALAEQRFGATGRARLARLLADLGDRGFLAGVAAAADAPDSRLRRLLRPREKSFSSFGPWVDGVYRRGGWVLFTRPALYAIAALIVVGLAAFIYLIVGRYGTPFVVSKRIGLGAFVFLLGRFAVVAVHETAHGLTMASFGRRVERAGLKLVVVFPYAFVDTSEAWFEPRRRRIAVSAAGPVSDFSLGALFSICCLVLAPGTVRDVFFQLAFAAYIGACFNLNPFLERDGYHMLSDLLREPSLRRRAREQFARRLSGGGAAEDSPVLARYSLFALAWSVLAALFAIAMTFRYKPTLEELAPAEWIVWLAMGIVWVAVFVPVIVVLARPLAQRLRPEG